MSDLSPIGGGDELLALARRVLGDAGGGEQVEVFAARSRSVRVDAHGGAVESLSVAESAGVGVRCIVDGRQGFAHCGTLDEASVRATLAEARDNARFAEVDPWAGLAEPDGVSPVMPPFNPEAIGALGVDDKVAMAVALERAASSADPRVTGVRVAAYADHVGEVAIVSTTGIEALSRGARHAVFVEHDRQALTVVRANLASTALADRAEVVPRRVEVWLDECARAGDEATFDVAFCDPPYAFDAWADLLARVPARLVVIESDRPVAVEGWVVTRERRYGTTFVMFAEPSVGRPDRPTSRLAPEAPEAP